MIRINFTEPKDDEWQKWVTDAQRAAAQIAAVIAAGQTPHFNAALYKRRRQVFYDAFHGKCAYCERKFVLDQSGDIDHFRPKGAVTDENDQEVLVPTADGHAPHPGYYWLAYDWRNLLPCCARCNRPTRLPDGRLVGKSTRFPVQGGNYAWRPGNEQNEAPLFLNPMFDDPEADLGLDVATGLVFPKTPRGKFCIATLDLNREGLPEERRKRFTEVRGRMIAAFSHLQYEHGDEAVEELAAVIAYVKGTAELSWAGRIAFEQGRQKFEAMQRVLAG